MFYLISIVQWTNIFKYRINEDLCIQDEKTGHEIKTHVFKM